MEELQIFFTQYGLSQTVIAIAGLLLLGILKYRGAFARLEEKKRHICYLCFSVGFSVLLSALVLFIRHEWQMSLFLSLATATLTLNQSFYSLYKATSLEKLTPKILSFLMKKAKENSHEKS